MLAATVIDAHRHPTGHSAVMVPSAGEDGHGWTTLKDSLRRVCAIAEAPPLDEQEVRAWVCCSMQGSSWQCWVQQQQQFGTL